MKNLKTAEEHAKKDIMKSLKEDPNYKADKVADDRWNMSSGDVFNKDSKKLNNELDLPKEDKKDKKLKKFEDFSN